MYKTTNYITTMTTFLLYWFYTTGLLLLAGLCTSCNGSIIKTPVYISGFFSFSGSWESRDIIPAVEMALDHVNRDARILPEYELKMILNDTECDPNTATYTLYDQLTHEPTKVAILGGGCSVSTRPIAANSGFWNLTSVSYAASSPSLSDRDDYPYFFRTIIPDSLLNPARIYMMKHFNWRRVATLHGKEDIFVSAVDDLEKRLVKANITLLSSQSVTARHVDRVIDALQFDDSKIIAMNMYPSRARQTFCEAYKAGLMGEGYAWLILGWYGDKWWEAPNDDDEPLNCDIEAMRKAVFSSHYISIEMQQLDTSGTVSVANITADEYKEELLRDYLTLEKFQDYPYHPDSPLGYDAVWTIALMLHNASNIFKNQGLSLTDFNYTNHHMASTFFDVLRNVTFTGISGEVGFDRYGDRMGTVQVRQLQPECKEGWDLNMQHSMCVMQVNAMVTNCTVLGALRNPCPAEWSVGGDCCEQLPEYGERVVALYTDEWQWEGEFQWPGDGQPPSDKTPHVTERIRKRVIQVQFYVPFYIISVLGIAMCIFLIIFNTMYRNVRYIKLSSPGMNNIIIAGGLLIYIATFPASLANRDPWVIQYLGCQFRTITLTLGFLLSFGAMITKTWRVYKVAVFHKAPKRVVISNTQLYKILSVIVGIGCILIILLCIFEEVKEVVIAEMKTNITNMEIHTFFEFCSNQDSLLQLPVWGYNLILVIIGVILAFQTRQVTIDGLNDSKLIGICIYKLGLLAFIYILYGILAENNPAIAFTVAMAIYVYFTTFTLLMIFVPKIKHVFYDDGETGPASSLSNTGQSRDATSMADNISMDFDNLTDKLMKAESEVKRLKEELSKYNKQDDPHSGCGIWCYGTVCGCCTAPELWRITMTTRSDTSTCSTRDIDHRDIDHGDIDHGDIDHRDIDHGDIDHGDIYHGDQNGQKIDSV